MNTEPIRPAYITIEDDTLYLYAVDNDQQVYRLLSGSNAIIIKRTVVDDTDYVVTDNDYYISVINLSAARTITLPVAMPEGFTIHIKDASGLSATYPVTVETAGDETIDGEVNATIGTDYEALTFIFDGATNWEVN